MGTKRNNDATTTCGFRNHCYPGARFCPPLVSHIVSAGDRMLREGLAAGLIQAWNPTCALKASSTIRVKLSVRPRQLGFGKFSHGQFFRLTSRLSDAGLRCRPTKLIYPNHRPPPWTTEDTPRDRSKQLLEFGATPASQMPLFTCFKDRPDSNADQSVPRTQYVRNAQHWHHVRGAPRNFSDWATSIRAWFDMESTGRAADRRDSRPK